MPTPRTSPRTRTATALLASLLAQGCGSSAAGGADTTTSAGSGGSQNGSSQEIPPGLDGVVVLHTDTDETVCHPLCTEHADPSDDAEGDDWSSENGVSCVIPGSVTGHNQPCTTGEPIEEVTRNVAGVVVVDNSADTTKCVPLCQIVTDPADDPEGDDWSWENNESCIIPGTTLAMNQACMTGEPVPELEPRPGLILAIGAEPECVPLCVNVSEGDDPNSDWAYENNESCVLPQTETAEGRRDCTWGEWPPEYVPPPLTGNKVADGFYTEDGRLYDAYGNDFVIRGVNNAHIWYDGYAEYTAFHALDTIAGYGTNTVRIVWDTTGLPSVLADIMYRIVELGMVPMVEMHDATGKVAAEELLAIRDYYVRDDVVPILQNFREYLLVNIANEWSGQEGVYLETYQTVVSDLRAAGIEHTLVIDASEYGQDARSVFDNAEALLQSDPESNLLFSVHMYQLYGDPARVESVLNEAVDLGVPLIVGEFGHQLSGTDVAWEQILATGQELGLGWLAWSWMGNDPETEQLDLAEDWQGPLTPWGEDIFNGDNGIVETAEPASIFQ